MEIFMNWGAYCAEQFGIKGVKVTFGSNIIMSFKILFPIFGQTHCNIIS